MRQRSFFRPQVQALIAFLGGARFKQRAAQMTGYDIAPAGHIRFAALLICLSMIFSENR